MSDIDLTFDDDLRIARLVMTDGPKTDAEYALAQRVIALAAAAPLIEAQVRERVVAALEQVASDRSYDSDESITEAYLDAAKIAWDVTR